MKRIHIGNRRRLRFAQALGFMAINCGFAKLAPAVFAQGSSSSSGSVASNTKKRIEDVSNLAELFSSTNRSREIVIVVFSTTGCPFCELLRRSYLPSIPLEVEGVKVHLREVFFDRNTPLIDFAGRTVTHRQFAREHQVKLSPTLISFDSNGQALSAPLIGIGSADFYAYYLDQLVLSSALAVRRRQNPAKP